MKKIIVSDKVYVPIELYRTLPKKVGTIIKNKFSIEVHKPELCPSYHTQRCEKFQKNGKTSCYKCNLCKTKIKLYYKNRKWFKFERGDKSLTKKIIRLIKSNTSETIKIIDRSINEKLPKKLQYNIKWNKLDERKEKQKEVVKGWLEDKYGQIICPPRSGKTLVATILSSKLKRKRTAIVAHQKELIEQFYNTFITFTDIEDVGKFNGRSLIKINPKEHEVDDLVICLFTWQQFLNKKKLIALRDKFSFLIVDESHRASADKYHKKLSRFKAKYKAGLTGTPKRRDKLNIRQDLILGPPKVFGGDEQLLCNYIFNETLWEIPNYKMWTNRIWGLFWNRIAKEKDRNEFIVSHIKEDLAKGHKIIIPVKRKLHIDNLYNEIIKEGIDVPVIKYISNIKDRVKETENIRKGKYSIVIATYQMIALGFDAPPMSCIYIVNPIYDKYNFYQLYSRVRTKYKEKPKPLIRVFIDEGGIVHGFKNMVSKEFKEREFIEVL